MVRALSAPLALAVLLLTTATAQAAAFDVDSLRDAPDANTADATCATTAGDCTLRAAIQQANALPGDDTVGLPLAGTYRLSGELLVSGADALTVAGPDGAAAGRVITGQGATRVFHVSSSGPVTLADVTVRDGRVAGNGGGILHDGSGALTVERSSVLGNVAIATGAASGGGGGGVYHANPAAPLTVIDSTISYNTATVAGTAGGGGGLFLNGVLADIRNATISRNVLRASGSPTGSGGAGLYADDGGGILNSVTMVANSAAGLPGGAIFRRTGPGVGVSNTILANNSAPTCAPAGAVSSGGNNIETTDTCGLGAAGDKPATPSFVGELEDNGGPTPTHRLPAGHLGIDAGGGGCEATDQRGVERSFNQCDIGAYEFDGQADAAIPNCTRTGAIPVTITAASGQGVESVQYKVSGGPTQVVATPGGGSQAQRLATVPEGRRPLEYWGDFTNDPSSGQPGHRRATVVVDRTNPVVAVKNPNPFRVFVIKRRVGVDVDASDSISGLVADPTGTRGLDTSRRGTRTFAPAAVDLCANRSAAPFEYRVLAPGLGIRTVLELARGTVLVRAAGSGGGARASQKGRRFTRMREPREIAIRSLIDTRRGTVRLTSSRDARTAIQDGDFAGGVFQVLQSRSRRARGLTELRLKGSSFRRCGRVAGSGRAAAAQRRRVIRRLRGNARGRFRTRGRYSAATVRGTVWTVEDRCDGTLTKVRRGRVAVRDFRRRKTVIVRAGKSYLARATR